MSGLRLVVFDATQQKRPPRALGYSWRYGTPLYGVLGRHDGAFGARNFAEAFAWLNGYQLQRQIQELQFWGHGKWGHIFIDRQPLGRELLEPGHSLNSAFQRFRERLAPNPLIWFRTCETLGAQPGHDFASALADVTGARVAGHTFVIGFFQSGLHCLRPGRAPHWSNSEGIARGSPEAPQAAHDSSPWAPNTITCLTGEIPPDF